MNTVRLRSLLPTVRARADHLVGQFEQKEENEAGLERMSKVLQKVWGL
jgi:hypothetical protein